MSDVIDLQRMLAPLPDSVGGVGEDLRTDYSPSSLYQQLRDARAEARAEERAQDASDDNNAVPQQWRDVKRLSILCLTEKTRDLEIAAWLAEALVRIDGLNGLRDAAKLLSGLLGAFWDHVHPLPDEDGMEGRAAPLAGLSGGNADGTLLQPLRRMPLFARTSGGEASLYLWTLAEETAALTDQSRREARRAAGIPELALLEREALAAKDGWSDIGDRVREASDAWRHFGDHMSVRLGDLSPSTRRVADVLTLLSDMAARFGAAPSVKPVAARVSTPPAVARAPAAALPPAAIPGNAAEISPIASREQAIRRMEELAQFFRITEPHSPLSYALDTLARRASLPFPALLEEVLADKGARHAMLSVLGIHPFSPSTPVLAAVQQEKAEPLASGDAEPAAQGIVW